jgi:hypothetical protein
MHPVQITLGTCKFSIMPLADGIELEFTDFATDITWLSGPLYARLHLGLCQDSFSYVRELTDLTWDIEGDSVVIHCALGGIGIEFRYRLESPPIHVEETISIRNPADSPLEMHRLRLGPTWSPPLAWWTEWAGWNVVMIPLGFGLSCKESMTIGRSLASLRDCLEPGKPSRDAVPVVPESLGTGGWIFSDESRFLAVAKSPVPDVAGGFCPVDIFHLPKCPPSLVMGGISRKGASADKPIIFESGQKTIFPPTVFIPGIGGIRDSVDAYLAYVNNG